MAKASKPKRGAAAGVKAKLPSTKEKGKARAPPAVVDDSDDDCEEVVAVEARTSKRLVVKWDDDRTTRLLDWLDQHPDDRNRLFSDSTVAAKQEGRRKVTAKGNKTRYHEALAKAVFDSPDEEPSLRIWYLREPGKFTTSVLNYLSRLRVQYREFNKELGKTGAGLKYDDITPGSDIHNLIDKLSEGFPYWERLHGYWRTLPNYNPMTVTSDPGQDLESDAVALVGGGRVLDSEGNKEEPTQFDMTYEDWPPSEADQDVDADADDDMGFEDASAAVVESPTPRSAPSQAAPLSFGSSRKGNAATLTKPLSSAKKVSPTSSRSTGSSLGKRGALAAFGVDSENDSRLAATLRSKKLDRDLLNLEVQKAKINLLAQREVAQNARQAEANQIKMLELQLQMQMRPPQMAHTPNVAPAGHQQMVPANADMVFGNGNLGLHDLLHAPLDDYNNNQNGDIYHLNV